MKKILLQILIIIFCFSPQICLAEGENQAVPLSEMQNTTLDSTPALQDEEDINRFFEEETTPAPQTKEVQVSNQEPSETQFNGYLEYNQQEEDVPEAEEEAIMLEPVESARIKFNEPKKMASKSAFSNSKKPTFHPMEDEFEHASKFATQEYSIKPVSAAFVQKAGNVSFGTMYDSSLGGAQVGYSTSIFTKIEGKYCALKTAFSKSTNNNYDAYSDKIYFVPELKLTKRLSLLDVMQSDVYQINKKNEFVLRYSPNLKRYADDVQFEIGAGQSFYENNYLNSSVRFSTNFKI